MVIDGQNMQTLTIKVFMLFLIEDRLIAQQLNQGTAAEWLMQSTGTMVVQHAWIELHLITIYGQMTLITRADLA